jgi:ribosomal protein S18 acetylase RimI-like enzyme
MKLTDEQKKEYFELLWDMTQKSYSPAQTPSREKFQRVVDEGDVFVLGMVGPPPTIIVPYDIVGYALVSPSMYPVLLRSIVVLEGYRGLGLGAVLLTEVANFYRAAGYSRIVLHVMVHNSAQKLYFDAGYRVTRVLANYYAPEGDGLEMEKIL